MEWINMKKNNIIYNTERIINDRRLIFEMIDASYELAARKGQHPLEKGCNCISCVNKRKRLLKQDDKEWKFRF